mmetsp:Transcript_6781/g.17585  ORF Transcript_6781/g.17585 Transcript_6781/m.17585 type:complete len:703 (+) Transcript_6781:106-2214(+)
MSLENCSYPENYESLSVGEQMVMQTYVSDVVFGRYECSPFKWQYLVNLVAMVVWLVLGRWLYDGYMRVRLGPSSTFSLAEQLTKQDNKALAVDFAAFLFSLCWITRGALSGLKAGVDDARYFGSFFAYQILGYCLILVTRYINDKCILRTVENLTEIVEHKNVGVACAQGGATIATAIIISAAAAGEDAALSELGEGLGATLLFWIVGQLLLICHSLAADGVTALPVVQQISAKLVKREEMTTSSEASDALSDISSSEVGPTSLLKQASAGNVAAGLTLGFDMVASAIVIAAPVIVGYSMLAWLIFVLACLAVVTPLLHLYMDHVILRGASITINILRHQNWGAAIHMGSLKLLTAILLQSLYRQNCDVGGGASYSSCVAPKQSGSLGDKLTALAVPAVFNIQSLVDLLLLLVVILLAKGVYYLRFRCSRVGSAAVELDAELANPDNNAISISLAAYTVAQGLALTGVAYCPSDEASLHGANLAMWTAVGVVLLYLAFLLNDLVLLCGVNNTLKLQENNLAVALFESGSFLSCGLILRSNLLGTGGDETAEEIGRGLALVCTYWLVAQAVLLLFAYLYRLITSFDDHAELAAGNASAGLSGGLTLVALALVMSYPLAYYSSVLVVLPIALVGALALVLLRMVVDVLVLPGDRLDSEIKTDRNWGAALIEGAVAVGVAFVGQLYVPPPGDPQYEDLICPTNDL